MAEDAFSQNYTTGTGNKTLSLESIFRTAVGKNFPVAIWRLPETEAILACVSFESAVPVEQPFLEQSPYGFLFCPFHASLQNQKLFFKVDAVYDTTTEEFELTDQTAGKEFAAFKDALETGTSTTAVAWHLPSSEQQQVSQTETAYKDAVAGAVAAIREEKMEKVVLSRNNTETLPGDFDPIVTYRKMLWAYPKAFVSLVSIPDTGTWLGASPEILVSINTQQVFKTVALAGTQPANGETDLANAIWRQKEIEEQGMVERYILSCFKKLRLREYTEVGPRTVVAGNLMHLRTDFKVDLKEVDFPTLGTDMLHLLHPTSAICGLPKEPAEAFIKKHEGYDRSYYSGYLGPVNSPVGTHLYVNLRCMQLLQDKAVVYAGAGITAESSPEKEYQETQYKMQTMRKILKGV